MMPDGEYTRDTIAALFWFYEESDLASWPLLLAARQELEESQARSVLIEAGQVVAVHIFPEAVLWAANW